MLDCIDSRELLSIVPLLGIWQLKFPGSIAKCKLSLFSSGIEKERRRKWLCLCLEMMRHHCHACEADVMITHAHLVTVQQEFVNALFSRTLHTLCMCVWVWILQISFLSFEKTLFSGPFQQFLWEGRSRCFTMNKVLCSLHKAYEEQDKPCYRRGVWPSFADPSSKWQDIMAFRTAAWPSERGRGTQPPQTPVCGGMLIFQSLILFFSWTRNLKLLTKDAVGADRDALRDSSFNDKS